MDFDILICLKIVLFYGNELSKSAYYTKLFKGKWIILKEKFYMEKKINLSEKQLKKNLKYF